MKVSIVTVVYNGETTIADTLDSLLRQTYIDLELIVIDGKSQDRTLEIIKSYGDKIHHVVSERDEGIYDAMNKGIKLATGDIIGILNSDDFYVDNQVVKRVVSKFYQDPHLEALYADLVLVNSKDTNKVVRYFKAGDFYRDSFQRGWHPPHPTLFIKRTVYERFGLFDTSMKISADYEIMLRFLYKYCIKAAYLPEVIVRMRLGGASTGSLMGIVRANYETLLAWKRNGIRPPLFGFFIFLKLKHKVLQFFNREK